MASIRFQARFVDLPRTSVNSPAENRGRAKHAEKPLAILPPPSPFSSSPNPTHLNLPPTPFFSPTSPYPPSPHCLIPSCFSSRPLTYSPYYPACLPPPIHIPFFPAHLPNTHLSVLPSLTLPLFSPSTPILHSLTLPFPLPPSPIFSLPPSSHRLSSNPCPARSAPSCGWRNWSRKSLHERELARRSLSSRLRGLLQVHGLPRRARPAERTSPIPRGARKIALRINARGSTFNPCPRTSTARPSPPDRKRRAAARSPRRQFGQNYAAG